MSLSEIINITITRETSTVTQVGFGTPLILGFSNRFGGNEVRSYTSIDGVAEDFETTDDEYISAAAIFSQSPSVSEIKIAYVGAVVAGEVTLAYVGSLTSGSLTTTINNQAVTTAFDTDEPTTLAAHALAIVALADVDSATVVGQTIEIVFNDGYQAVVEVTDDGDFTSSSVTEDVEAVTYQDLLTDVATMDDDWYCLLINDVDTVDAELTAAWIEARLKICIIRTNDVTSLAATTTDIGAKLNALGYERTAVIYSGSAALTPDAAWAGKCLSENPGSITWAFKTLSGVSADGLTSTAKTNLDNKKVNHYTSISGISITRYGTMASGEYIDIMRGTDWLQVRMQERIFTKLANSKKIPYTEKGFGIIENEIRAQLAEGESDAVGLLVPGSSVVTMPDIATISATDKGNRHVPNIMFEAQLAGAVHKMTIRGRVYL